MQKLEHFGRVKENLQKTRELDEKWRKQIKDRETKKFQKHEDLQKRQREEHQKELDKQKGRWDVVRKKHEEQMRKDEKNREKLMREDLM